MQERNIHVSTPEKQEGSEGTTPSTQVSANPNPRANENLNNPSDEETDQSGVGSEITDGEAG